MVSVGVSNQTVVLPVKAVLCISCDFIVSAGTSKIGVLWQAVSTWVQVPYMCVDSRGRLGAKDTARVLAGD